MVRTVGFGDQIKKGVLTVKSTFDTVSNVQVSGHSVPILNTFVFKHIQKSPVPSKVREFLWQLLLDRIPCKVNLATRRALPSTGSVLCRPSDGEPETARHLFLHCKFTSNIWQALSGQVGETLIIPPNLFTSFAMWVDFGWSKRVKSSISLIQHAAIWSSWKNRNDRVFNNKVVTEAEIVEHIKVLSLQWFQIFFP